MAKRKHEAVANGDNLKKPFHKKSKSVTIAKSNGTASKPKLTSKPPKAAPTPPVTPSSTDTIQIIVGSYDRILHGLTATIEPKTDKVDFADTFLFSAHNSAIRCVALSPVSSPAAGQAQKVFLASGSTDERINVYNLSAHPPSRKTQDALARVAPRPILENPRNREVGALLHHGSSVTALRFPTRSKLLSASEDSTVAVTRTRDWSLLSTIKAPVPKPMGRPSGDTAPLGATPSGVNDLAIHPSMKLMITVSKGERCMRLWNLVTGKRAGVLNFGRSMLAEVGEGRHATGEGRRVVWGMVDGADEFAVAFERDVVVFGMDSVPRCRVMGLAKTKVHQVHYVSIQGEVEGAESESALLAVSTEDGRVILYSTKDADLSTAEDKDGKTEKYRLAKKVGAIGGKEAGIIGRIKDFVVVRSQASEGALYVATGSSDGKVRLWRVLPAELGADGEGSVGKLLGTYETQSRITCMTGFAMVPRPEGVDESDEEVDEEGEESDDDDED